MQASLVEVFFCPDSEPADALWQGIRKENWRPRESAICARASGTSNMKLMMNGVLTSGTRDGATIEMAKKPARRIFFFSA
jgi:hypothetical protein